MFKSIWLVVKKFFSTLWGVFEILFFTVLPTIALLIFFFLSGKSLHDFFFYEAFERGEFYVYSLALFSSALFTSKYHNGKEKYMPLVMLLIITSLFYSFIVVEDQVNMEFSLSNDIIFNSSLILFFISIIFTYFSVSKQKEKSPDAKGTNENQVQEMEKKVRF